MISLESWYEDKGQIKRLKLDGHFCFNDKPRTIEIKLPNNYDGMHNSIIIPIGDLIRLLEEHHEI